MTASKVLIVVTSHDRMGSTQEKTGYYLPEVRAQDYKAILFAGGHGAMWDFPHDESAAKAAAGIYETGGVVAVVCHGPAAFLVRNKIKRAWRFLLECTFVAEKCRCGSALDHRAKSSFRRRSGRYYRADIEEVIVTSRGPARAAETHGDARRKC